MAAWDPDTINDVIRVAHLAADAARKETLGPFRSPELAPDNKDSDGFDPVTAADRAAELAIREVLERERPQDAILGEEYDPVSGTSGLTWVLDPIDGTRGYISGTPTWGTLISIAGETGPKFGIIDQPYIGERFSGGFGTADLVGPMGASKLRCRSGVALAEATLLTTFPEVGSTEERLAFEAVAKEVRLTRYGMDCYGYALVASGQVDLVIEAGLNAYDIQAPIAVVEAAGGIVTDWNGGPAHEGGRALAAANPDVHAAALKILRAAING